MKKLKDDTFKPGGKKLKQTQFNPKNPKIPRNYTYNNTGMRGK